MSLVGDVKPATGLTLQKDGRKVFDMSLLPAADVEAAKIVVTGQVIDYHDPTHADAYYWRGGGTSPVKEGYAGFVTLLPEEHAFTDILLGTVPAGTDRLEVKATITRTTAPSNVFGDTVLPEPKMGQEIRLKGGSCALEETAAFSRGFDIVLSGTNVYLRRYQSVGQSDLASGGFQQWSASNSASDNGSFTYGGGGRGPLVALTSYVPDGTTFAGGAYTHQRGQGNQGSLADSTNYHSVYSADFTIWPSRFNTDTTIYPPAGKAAVFLGAPSATFSAANNVSLAAVPFGTPDATRNVLIAFSSASDGAAIPVSGVTIGGVAATKLVEQSGSGGVASIWMAAVPTGNSGTIAVSYGSSHAVDISATVYALYHLASTTPVDTKATSSSGSALALSTSSAGFAFAAETHIANPITASNTLTGLTQTGFQALDQSGASGSLVNHGVGYQQTTGAGLSISATWSTGALAACSLA